MKEQKTISDLNSYYEDIIIQTKLEIDEQDKTIYASCMYDEESNATFSYIQELNGKIKCYEEFLSQLKQLKEDIVKQSFGEDGYERVYIEIDKILGAENKVIDVLKSPHKWEEYYECLWICPYCDYNAIFLSSNYCSSCGVKIIWKNNNEESLNKIE